MYKYSDDKENSKIQILSPGLIIAILAFLIIKYKDNLFNTEPMMAGNYFDATTTV